MPPSPKLVTHLESIVYGDRRDPSANAVRGGLRFLSGVYRIGIAAYLLPFNIGLRRRFRLRRPVVSVGNLTVGGTGKTTVVRYLCRGFAALHAKPAILSYGYGGELGGKFGVVCDGSGPKMPPAIAGDEPVMLASSLPNVPIIVCKDRCRSGKTAVREFRADVVILDDGLQVWKLHRDFDVVLVNAENPFDNRWTLPAGKLRERAEAIRRADCVIATCTDPSNDYKDQLELVRRISHAPVFLGWFKPSELRAIGSNISIKPTDIRGRKVMALSSIANPHSFESTLGSLGADIRNVYRMPDHHMYTLEDVRRISETADKAMVEMIVTTEKDAVKLLDHHFSVPIFALRIDMQLTDEEVFWNHALRCLGMCAK